MNFNYRELFKGLSQYRPPLNYELTGKRLTIKFSDSRVCHMDFQSENHLFIAFDDIRQGNPYEAVKIDNLVYFLHFEIEHQNPRRCISLVYDLDSSQAVLFLIRSSSQSR